MYFFCENLTRCPHTMLTTFFQRTAWFLEQLALMFGEICARKKMVWKKVGGLNENIKFWTLFLRSCSLFPVKLEFHNQTLDFPTQLVKNFRGNLEASYFLIPNSTSSHHLLKVNGQNLCNWVWRRVQMPFPNGSRILGSLEPAPFPQAHIQTSFPRWFHKQAQSKKKKTQETNIMWVNPDIPIIFPIIIGPCAFCNPSAELLSRVVKFHTRTL